jgi:hypothetical protein
MRGMPIRIIFGIVAVLACIAGAWVFFADEIPRSHAVEKLLARPSYIKLGMRVDYPDGHIASEEYTLINDNGKSEAKYAVTDRRGSVARFSNKIEGYDVSFAFGKAVQDGIWELNTKHRRALDEVAYTVRVEQTADGGHGTRSFSFTNPQYWASAAGRQYHIVLDPKKPAPSEQDILKLESTSNAEPRYLEIVNDFKTFGSPAFKRTVAKAREQLLKS